MSSPIHVTEMNSFFRCRLLWYWTARPPRGLYLEPRVPRPALHLGQLVHAALQDYYDRGADPRATFTKMALEAEKKWARTETLWPEDVEKLKEQSALGLAMLKGYVEWAAKKDNTCGFQPIATETSWTVQVAPGLVLGGRYDMVVKMNGALWVLDFKTTSSTRVGWTARDLQATAYTMAARSLYGPDVRGVIFRFIRKKEPYTYEKLILKDGSLTRRKTLADLTTYENYLKAISVAVYKEGHPNLSLQECEVCLDRLDQPGGDAEGDAFRQQITLARRMYWDELQRLKEGNHFYWDVHIEKSPQQLERYKRLMLLPAMKIMSQKRVWVAPTGLGAAFAVCKGCSFREPCRQVMDGADYKDTLHTYFQQREE